LACNGSQGGGETTINAEPRSPQKTRHHRGRWGRRGGRRLTSPLRGAASTLAFLCVLGGSALTVVELTAREHSD